MFTFLDKSVQLESEPERSRKFSILHAEKHRNQWQDHFTGLRLTQISVLVEFGNLVCLISDLTNIISRYSNKSSYFEQKLDSRVYRQAMKWWWGHFWKKESKLESCFGLSLKDTYMVTKSTKWYFKSKTFWGFFFVGWLTNGLRSNDFWIPPDSQWRYWQLVQACDNCTNNTPASR